MREEQVEDVKKESLGGEGGGVVVQSKEKLVRLLNLLKLLYGEEEVTKGVQLDLRLRLVSDANADGGSGGGGESDSDDEDNDDTLFMQEEAS